MPKLPDLKKRVNELETLLEVSERKADILTNLLKEAGAEYEQTLEKIKISEANFRAIFENAPEAIYIIDADSLKIIDFNPFVLKWLGYSREEFLGISIEDILIPGTTHVKENIQLAIAEGFVHIPERQFQKRDGSIADAEVTGTVLDYEGKRCFVALVRDITERKKLEEFQRYKALFGSVSDPVFINDARGRFLEVNDFACDCLGYTREQLCQMTLRDITLPTHYGTLSEMGEKIHAGETFQFELELLDRSGNSIPYEFQGRLITYQQKAAFLSVARNLSVRKKLQQTLIKTERLSAVGEMASGVAHNFNNLLQMIMVGAEAAMTKLEVGKIRECQRALRNILNASQRGADVVRRIKDFTFLGPDTMGEGHPFDLQKLVSEAVELTKPLWKPPSNASKYHLNVIGQQRCFVKGKSSEIYEVLVNLIRNALESMPSGGSLTISAVPKNGHVYLGISDTGCGILDEHLQRIFEPFFTTKSSQNSGLGLSSCYGIVKKHGGEIHVYTTPGAGTEFMVILPQADAPQPIKQKEFASLENAPIRFLIIDDEINILKFMEMYFEDTEIDIATACSAREGLQAIRENPFDVVLCDLGMDEMNGLELGQELSDYCRTKGIPKIPFLLYTGLNKQFDTDTLAKAGIDKVVNKPTPCDELLKIVQDVVAQRNAHRLVGG